MNKYFQKLKMINYSVCCVIEMGEKNSNDYRINKMKFQNRIIMENVDS